MRVTVAICTWNRAQSLGRTLAAMGALRIPAGVEWELIVANNNSTDDTDAVISEYAGRLPIVRVFEARPGKSHAANAVIKSAKGDLLLWTDDDVIVDADWIAAYVHAANAWPQAAFFGGTVDPLFEAQAPEWIGRNLDLLSEPYALARHGAGTWPLEERFVVGANMATRIDAVRKHPFNTGLGPRGGLALRGEDTELLGRMRAAGLLGVWVGAARVQHIIAAHRLTSAYLWHWYAGLGAYLVERGPLPSVPLLMGAPRWAVKQYVALYLKCACLAPSRSAAWLRSLRQAGLMKGYIEEARRREGERG